MNKEPKINSNDFKDFINNNLIAIYIPTKVVIKNKDSNLLNYSLLILRDPINNLNAEFRTKAPSLNGVHIYSSIKNDFSTI